MSKPRLGTGRIPFQLGVSAATPPPPAPTPCTDLVVRTRYTQYMVRSYAPLTA